MLAVVLPACTPSIITNANDTALKWPSLNPRGTGAPDARDDDTLDAEIISRVMCPDVTLLTMARRRVRYILMDRLPSAASCPRSSVNVTDFRHLAPVATSFDV